MAVRTPGGQARNRLPKAVERTVPFGMLVQSLVIIWYARYGYHPDDAALRREAEPWYDTKTEPSFEDMLVKLRKAIIVTRFSYVGSASALQPELSGAPRLRRGQQDSIADLDIPHGRADRLHRPGGLDPQRQRPRITARVVALEREEIGRIDREQIHVDE